MNICIELCLRFKWNNFVNFSSTTQKLDNRTERAFISSIQTSAKASSAATSASLLCNASCVGQKICRPKCDTQLLRVRSRVSSKGHLMTRRLFSQIKVIIVITYSAKGNDVTPKHLARASLPLEMQWHQNWRHREEGGVRTTSSTHSTHLTWTDTKGHKSHPWLQPIIQGEGLWQDGEGDEQPRPTHGYLSSEKMLLFLFSSFQIQAGRQTETMHF